MKSVATSWSSTPSATTVRSFAAGGATFGVAGFVAMLLGAGIYAIIAPFPLAMTIALISLEALVALLQAYVFAILTCIYLNDALHPHH